MLWNNDALRLSLRTMTDVNKKKNLEAALDHVKTLTPLTGGTKCALLIKGIRHEMFHLTRGVSPNTVTIFFKWSATTPSQPIIWGLGEHVKNNTNYDVFWDGGKEEHVRLG